MIKYNYDLTWTSANRFPTHVGIVYPLTSSALSFSSLPRFIFLRKEGSVFLSANMTKFSLEDDGFYSDYFNHWSLHISSILPCCSLEFPPFKIKRIMTYLNLDRYFPRPPDNLPLRLNCLYCNKSFPLGYRSQKFCCSDHKRLFDSNTRKKSRLIDKMCSDISCPTKLSDDIKSIKSMSVDDLLSNFGDLE